VLAAVLLVVACGDDGDPGESVAPPLGTAPRSSSPGDGTAAPGGDGTAPGAPGTTATTSSSTGQPGPGASTTEAAPQWSGSPGSFAPALLRPEAGARLVVEVLSQAGAAPLEATVEHVFAVVRRESAKDVTVERREVPAGGETSWTPQAIRSFADTWGLGPQSADTVRLRLLFLRGGAADDDTALGVAVRGDVAAVFTERVEDAGAVLGTARIERAVAVHETGHLLGLVDLFLRTGREDPDHPGHSRNEGSVMYWAVESTLVGQLLGGGPPTDFDAADRADLARIRSDD